MIEVTHSPIHFSQIKKISAVILQNKKALI